MEVNPWAVGGVALIGALTFYLGFHSSRLANTTPDFLVARRLVRSRRNAAAVAGEYLSAASFLGVAAAIMANGANALWYVIGCTGGYLALLMFVSAPLRRSGAYTLPDFAEVRLGSAGLRKLCTFFVVLIGFFYLLPQLQAAGLTMSVIMPVPPWVGEVVVLVLVTVNVFGGGMRSITVVQAFQYWVKVIALAVPTMVLVVVFAIHHPAVRPLSAQTAPNFRDTTTITVKTPVRLRASESVLLRVHGTVDHFPRKDSVAFWESGTVHDVDAGTALTFPAGSAVPVVTGLPATNASWLTPDSGGYRQLLSTYSLIVALALGTLGLPHVLVRFYTNPSGRAARRSTLHVLLLLSLFYMFPTMLGVLSRLYVPQLLLTGPSDAAILMLPAQVLPGLAGQMLTAVVAMGAFAAFLSTSSGLLVTVAGVLATDLLPGRVRDFRLAALITGAVPLALALSLPTEGVSVTVGLSFSLAASTFCPVLLLGVWWRKLTWVGAAAGIVVGGGLVVIALAINLIGEYTRHSVPPLIMQPALITVPAAFLTVLIVSKATARRIPPDVSRVLLRMHAPDPLGFVRDRDVARFGDTDEKTKVGGKHSG